MTETENTPGKIRPWEIVGSRITVYHVLQELLQPEWTELRIAEFYGIEPEQVAVARAYIFANFESVMARHKEIERRRLEQMEAQWATPSNPSVFESFANWTRARNASPSPDTFPPFVEWASSNRVSADLVGSG